MPPEGTKTMSIKTIAATMNTIPATFRRVDSSMMGSREKSISS